MPILKVSYISHKEKRALLKVNFQDKVQDFGETSAL